MTSPNPSACCNGAGGCGSANEAGSGCDKKKIDEPSLSSSKICARCSSNPSDVPTSSFGSAALCSSCLRKALRSRVAREAVDLGIKGQRVVVAWSGGPCSRLLAHLLAAVAAPASYPGARPSFEVAAAVRVDCRPWRRLHRSKAAGSLAGEPQVEDASIAAAASTSTETAAAAASPPTTVVPIWVALAEEATEGLRRLELLHASLEETGDDDDGDDDDEGAAEHEGEQRRRRKKRRRRPRAELAMARRRAERSLVRAALLRFSRSHGVSVIATAETATRCAASAVAAAAAGAGAALPLEVAACDRRFCLSEKEGEAAAAEGSVSFVRPFVSVPASDVQAAARLLGLTTPPTPAAAAAAAAGKQEEDESENEQEQPIDGVLAAASDFLGAAQRRVPSTATSVVAALSRLAPCGWAGRKREDASRSLAPRELCDLCAAGPWSRGDGAEVEVEVGVEGRVGVGVGVGGGEEDGEKKLVLLRLCYPCSTVALGAPPAPAGAAPAVPRAAARKMAQALLGGVAGREEGGGGLWGRR